MLNKRKEIVNNIFIRFIRNIPLFTILNLVFILICSFILNATISLLREDVFNEELKNTSRLYQTFLDSSSGKLENKIYTELHEIEYDEDGLLSCSDKSLYDMDINNDMVYGLNEISKNLKLITFTLDKDCMGETDLTIMFNTVIYKVKEYNGNFIMINKNRARDRYDTTKLTELLQLNTYTELIIDGTIIDKHILLNSSLINRILRITPTNWDEQNTFVEEDHIYYYNMAVLPRYAYFNNEKMECKRKIGFMAIYNDLFIEESIKDSTEKVDRIQNIMGYIILINAITSIVSILYSHVILKNNKKYK